MIDDDSDDSANDVLSAGSLVPILDCIFVVPTFSSPFSPL